MFENMPRTWRGWVRWFDSNGKLVAESNVFGFEVLEGPEETNRARATLRKAWHDARMEMNPRVADDELPEGLALTIRYEVERVA